MPPVATVQTGGTFNETGTLSGSGTFTNGGTLAPGDGLKKAGDLNVSGSYTQGSSGALTIDLGGTIANTKYDVLNIAGAATLAGTLNVDLISGFTPVVGNSFTIMNYTSETGTFATKNLPAITGDHWTVAVNPTNVVLTLVAGAASVAPQSLQSSSISALSTPAKQSGAALTARTTEPSRVPVTNELCSGLRILSSLSCVIKASSSVMHSAIMRPAQAPRIETTVRREKTAIGSAVRSSGAARTSSTPSAFTLSVPSFTVCHYVPTGMARMMGCR